MVAIFGSDGGFSIFEALNFVFVSEIMESDNVASKTRRSGLRRVGPPTVAVTSSVHPVASTVDATVFEIEVLRALLDMLGFDDHIEAHGNQR